jgi:hypothetical protein
MKSLSEAELLGCRFFAWREEDGPLGALRPVFQGGKRSKRSKQDRRLKSPPLSEPRGPENHDLALTRCWSGGDSNCRSHPTKSLVSRRIGTDLL